MDSTNTLQLSLLEGIKTSGGEGGIRTLGTGVSPYNGLAKGSFLSALTGFQEFTSDSTPPSRTRSLSFGRYCAPPCAPFREPRNQEFPQEISSKSCVRLCHAPMPIPALNSFP